MLLIRNVLIYLEQIWLCKCILHIPTQTIDTDTQNTCPSYIVYTMADVVFMASDVLAMQ